LLCSCTSIFHSIVETVVHVPFSYLTKNTVHLTAAAVSEVYISKSESWFKAVALVNMVQAERNSFTLVVRLFSAVLKSSSETCSVEFSDNDDIEPSEKYRFFVSHGFVII